MGTQLGNNTPIDAAKIWAGPHRLVIADDSQAFPSLLEDIIDPGTWALETGWADFGPTTDDGFEITREGDRSEGVAIDQRDFNIGGGNYEGVTMGGTCTVMYTDADTLKIKWELGATTDIPAVLNTNVHQTRTKIGNPSMPTKRRVAVLQQQANGMLRAFVFRLGSTELGGSVVLKKGDPEGTEVTWVFEPDLAITDGTEFGVYLEQQTP
jgi:hypothetical protein